VLRCATQFVTLFPPPSFVRAAACVLHATSFISSSVPLHCTRSQPTLFASRHGTLTSTHTPSKVCRYISHSQRYNTPWVPLRSTTSFIHFSSIQSTRCLLFLCSPCGPRSAFRGIVGTKPTLIRLTPYATRYPCTVRPRSRGRSTVRPSRGHSPAIPS
jgi:hypothetical protein